MALHQVHIFSRSQSSLSNRSPHGQIINTRDQLKLNLMVGMKSIHGAPSYAHNMLQLFDRVSMRFGMLRGTSQALNYDLVSATIDWLSSI